MADGKPLVPIAYAHPDYVDAVHEHLAAAVGFGPECDANVRTAVLASAGGDLYVGQVIQYIQVKNKQLQLCTVTVQEGEARPAH
jgi:hypothetical protein